MKIMNGLDPDSMEYIGPDISGLPPYQRQGGRDAKTMIPVYCAHDAGPGKVLESGNQFCYVWLREGEGKYCAKHAPLHEDE